MPSTRITKTDLRLRYHALLELFELTIPDLHQRAKLAQTLCPERSGSTRQKALQYAYAARYAVRSSSHETRLKKEVEALAIVASGAT